MAITTGELASIVGGTVEGDAARTISGIASLQAARADQVSFLANPRYAHLVATTAAGAVVVGPEFSGRTSATLIRCGNPDAAFARMAVKFAPAGPVDSQGVDPWAVVSSSARMGQGVSVGALAFVDDDVEIGEGTIIRPGVYVGRASKLGRGCLIYPKVTIRERTVVGDRAIIHSGAVIGADGFGYTFEDGRRVKIPQIGRVVIEDDVEIGANTTVDRARFGETVIERGVKIDNLVQIAHNVRIGEGTVIVSLCAVAGSTTVGRHCMIGGLTGIAGHLTIGDDVMIAARSGVTKDVPSGSSVSGFPAEDHRSHLRLQAELRQLAGAARRLERIEEQLAELARRTRGG